MPLELRRKKFTLNYICGLKSVPANPALLAVFDIQASCRKLIKFPWPPEKSNKFIILSDSLSALQAIKEIFYEGHITMSSEAGQVF